MSGSTPNPYCINYQNTSVILGAAEYEVGYTEEKKKIFRFEYAEYAFTSITLSQWNVSN